MYQAFEKIYKFRNIPTIFQKQSLENITIELLKNYRIYAKTSVDGYQVKRQRINC